MGSSSTKLPFPPTAPSTSTPPQAANLPPDPWLCSSILQKAIRRGDADVAADAGVTLHRLRGSSIWRRLVVIAFEDIGAASPGALVNAVAACTDPAWRKQAGGNTAVVSSVARVLADAAKDRSADHLICCARSHPSLARVRQLLTSLPVHERITMAMDRSLPLTEQAAAAWYSSGVEWGDESRVGPGDLDAPVPPRVQRGSLTAQHAIALATGAA
jgi:MgsA AAA+ ATPase C terminal